MYEIYVKLLNFTFKKHYNIIEIEWTPLAGKMPNIHTCPNTTAAAVAAGKGSFTCHKKRNYFLSHLASHMQWRQAHCPGVSNTLQPSPLISVRKAFEE